MAPRAPTPSRCECSQNVRLPARPRCFKLAAPVLLCGLLVGLATALVACSSKQLSELPRVDSDGTTVDLAGDWDDAYAAADLAISEAEMATFEESGSLATGLWFWKLTTIESETGELELTRDDANVIRARAIIGRRGDRDREAVLLGHLRDRLQALAGRDAAPINSPMGVPE